MKGSCRGRLYGIATLATLLIEGSMAGDCSSSGTLEERSRELTVSGDEMTGKGVVGNNRQVVLRLRRGDRGASPPR